MVFESLKNTSVNLPLVGAVSVAAVIVVGIGIFFLTRRKKSVKLTF